MSQKKELTFEAIAIKGNIGYASDHDSNSLFRVDMETGECTFVSLFDDESVDRRRLHSSAMWIEDKVYFIPLAGDRISIFNTEDNSMQSIQIPLPNKEKYSFYRSNHKFVRIVRNKNYLWLVPATYPGVIRLDLQTNELKVFEAWVSDERYMFTLGLCEENERFFIPSGNSNVMLIFDMDKEFGCIEHIGTNSRGAVDMCKLGDTYWLAPSYEGPIVSWNPSLKQVNEYSVYPSDFKAGRVVFASNYRYNDGIIFLPADSNCALTFINGKLEIEKSQQWKQSSASRLAYLFETDAYRYYRELDKEKVSRFYKISKADNTLSGYSFFYFENGERTKKWVEAMVAKQEVVKENDSMSLDSFIQEILG